MYNCKHHEEKCFTTSYYNKRWKIEGIANLVFNTVPVT